MIRDFSSNLSHESIQSLSPADRLALCQWLRDTLVSIVSRQGGHLGANLGMVELTVALHTVFDTAVDRLVFDVGHQAYVHKILTGRLEGMQLLRADGGVSGFTKRSESPHDAFGAGHSSTSISAALGLAKARDILNLSHHVVAVIGDGAMSAGMAFEALNNARSTKTSLTVILNDNGMSISPAVGAISTYFARLFSSPSFQSLRDTGIAAVRLLPSSTQSFLQKAEEILRNRGFGKGIWFEELGFYYIGPVDGHDVETLIALLHNIRIHHKDTPVLLHVRTQKGKGYLPAENSPDCYHSLAKFSPDTATTTPTPADPTYTHIVRDTLLHFAAIEPHLVAITAAMATGTGLDSFASAHPDRFFDVGIAEQHAITFAAGMACVPSMIPVVALYSTFLQRGLDQVIHDVALQSLPVRFMIDRAGFVGEDGMTHAGIFDLSLVAHLPSFVIMVPADGNDLSRMIATSLSITDYPSMVRYPRGTAFRLPHLPDYEDTEDLLTPLPVGKGRLLQHAVATDGFKTIALVALGSTVSTALLLAAELFKHHGVSCSVMDARFVRPLDTDLLKHLAQNHSALIVIEEHVGGAFSSLVLDFLLDSALLDHGLIARTFCIPSVLVHSLSLQGQRMEVGQDVQTLTRRLLALLSDAHG